MFELIFDGFLHESQSEMIRNLKKSRIDIAISRIWNRFRYSSIYHVFPIHISTQFFFIVEFFFEE
jgi:hypothetical protein